MLSKTHLPLRPRTHDKKASYLRVVRWLLILFLLPVPTYATSIFSWLDDEGIQNFGDRPRPTRQSYLTNPPPTFGERTRQGLRESQEVTSIEAQASENDTSNPMLETNLSGTPNERPTQPAVSIARHEMVPLTGQALTEACTRAYRTLGLLKRRPRTTIRDEDGRERLLDRSEHRAYVENIEMDIADYCK